MLLKKRDKKFRPSFFQVVEKNSGLPGHFIAQELLRRGVMDEAMYRYYKAVNYCPIQVLPEISDITGLSGTRLFTIIKQVYGCLTEHNLKAELLLASSYKKKNLK